MAFTVNPTMVYTVKAPNGEVVYRGRTAEAAKKVADYLDTVDLNVPEYAFLNRPPRGVSYDELTRRQCVKAALVHEAFGPDREASRRKRDERNAIIRRLLDEYKAQQTNAQ